MFKKKGKNKGRRDSTSSKDSSSSEPPKYPTASSGSQNYSRQMIQGSSRRSRSPSSRSDDGSRNRFRNATSGGYDRIRTTNIEESRQYPVQQFSTESLDRQGLTNVTVSTGQSARYPVQQYASSGSLDNRSINGKPLKSEQIFDEKSTR